MQSNSNMGEDLAQAVYAAAEKAEERAAQAQREAEAARHQADLVKSGTIDLSSIPVTVAIDDPWDAASSVGQEQSVEVTARGLAQAIKKAENTYGDPRTDGVLRYRVKMLLPSGDILVPDKVWQPYSKQPMDSVIKSRRDR